jgi:hypothetical protein
VFVTHGFQATLSRYLNERGIEAAEVKTEYGEDEEGGELPDPGDVGVAGTDAGEARSDGTDAGEEAADDGTA